MPSTTSVSPFVQRIEALINETPKTQRELAAKLGYERPNIITMFKQGTTRLPAGKVALLAEATGEDPVELIRMWLEEYEPDLLAAIEMHQRLLLTEVERALIMTLRRCRSGGSSPTRAAITPPPGPSLGCQP